jgi:hypothetical protein
MQIHEITKGPKRTDEGILDDLKAAVTATKTGYKQGGLKGVAKNLTSRTAYNQALQQNARADTNKSLDKLEKKWGSQIKRPLSYYVDQLQNPSKPEFKEPSAEAGNKIKELSPQFTQTFATDAPGNDQTNDLPMPQPGFRFMLPTSVTGYPTDYYMSDKGVWTNDNTPPEKVTDPKYIEKFNAFVLGGKVKEIKAQTPVSVPPTGKTKQVKQTAKTNKVAPAAGQEPDVNEPLGETHRASLEEGGNASRKARREAQRAAAKNPAAPVAPTAPQQKKGRANLKTDFGRWISGKLGGNYQEIIDTSPQINSELTKIFTKLTIEKDPAAVEQLFKKYVLTAKAAMLKAQVEGGVDDSEAQASLDDQAAQLSGEQGKKTGNQKLDQFLTQKLKVNLSESQVAISKDIHVKSPKGDYVKRASDQQWYDPNGILISQDKYADFVAKLDATPAAQARYQAERGKGSDVAAIKSREAAYSKAELDAAVKAAVDKAMAAHPQPAPPPPQATAADWAEHQAEVNRQNNAAMAKTMNDLRYAEYFNTGQQDYLKQQVAQLIGTR